jgi:hypothetical protein
MALNMKDNIKRERNMDTEFSNGQMGAPTMESSSKTICKVKVSKIGLMDASMKANIWKIKCTVKDCFNGLMDVSTKVSITKT